MGAIDMLFNNTKAIEDGFKTIFGIRKYLLIEDNQGRLICVFYDSDAGRALAEAYLKRQGLEKTLVKFETQTIRNKEEQFKEIIQYKIVLLDGELALYKDVQAKAQEYIIKGYTGKVPKYGINKYTTGSKK